MNRVILVIFGAVALSGHARASNGTTHLYVDVGNPDSVLFGACDAPRRPCRRITDALDRAREIRASEDDEANRGDIVIHVAKGTYIGTAGDNPGSLKEKLPLLLNVPGLRLRGETELPLDENGWPVLQSDFPSQTELKADPPLPTTGTNGVPFRSLVFVTRTDDGQGGVLSGDDTRISGIVFTSSGGGLYFGGVRGAILEKSVIRGASIGVHGGRAGVTVRGNLFTLNGCALCGPMGNDAFPTEWDIRDNRFAGNSNGGVLHPLNFTMTSSFLGPITAFSGIRFASDWTGGPSGPASGVSRIVHNDLSDNVPARYFSFGIRIFAVRSDDLSDIPGSGSLKLTVADNRIVGNQVGVWIDGGFPYRRFNNATDTRSYGMNLDVTFANNNIAGNLDADHLLSFTRNSASIRPNTLDPAHCSGQGTACATSWKYLVDSTITIRDLTGDLADADGHLVASSVDNPTHDLFDGGVLGNQLIYNGAVVPATAGPSCLFPRFTPPAFPQAQPLVLPNCVNP